MDHYFDLKALPDAELVQSAVVAQLLQMLHGFLPEYEGELGLDFPGYGQQRTLGGIIRVLGPEAGVSRLVQQLQDHRDCRDYGLLGEVKAIPDSTRFVANRRHHVKGNSRMQRHKKRHEQRGTWTPELALILAAAYTKPSRLPFIQLHSGSTGQQFLLFVDRRVKPVAKPGKFNSYGLSLDGSTVPAF